MNNIYLLDCTLRDGGYVNNWKFGAEAIREMKEGLERAGADIIELGFFRNEPVNKERSVFSDWKDTRERFFSRKKNAIYSAMIEGADVENLYPIAHLGCPQQSGIDLVRVCTWKRLTKEHLAYCHEIGKRGYIVSVQPTAVEQYNHEEFTDLLKRVNELHPYSIYVVDTWGSQSYKQVCTYLELAERYLDTDIKIGYHGHNNKMQALSCVQAAMNMGICHDLCFDVSIMGMGRGVGNLQTEILMDYLNETYGTNYDSLEMVNLFAKYLRNFYESNPWGYSLYHYLSAQYSCPQDFATYFRGKGYGEDIFHQFLKKLSPNDKVVFRASIVEEYLAKMGLY